MSRLLRIVRRASSVAEPKITEAGRKILAEEAAIEKTANALARLVKRCMDVMTGTNIRLCAENGDTWRKISLFVALPITALVALHTYKLHHEEEEEWEHVDKKFVPYPYLHIRNKQYFFGDRKHTLFHNPRYNFDPESEE